MFQKPEFKRPVVAWARHASQRPKPSASEFLRQAYGREALRQIYSQQMAINRDVSQQYDVRRLQSIDIARPAQYVLPYNYEAR